MCCHLYLSQAATISQLHIYARALLDNVIFTVWVRSVNEILPYGKFAEYKVLTLLILREKCYNSATPSLTQILTLISRADCQINWRGIVERYIVVK